MSSDLTNLILQINQRLVPIGLTPDGLVTVNHLFTPINQNLSNKNLNEVINYVRTFSPHLQISTFGAIESGTLEPNVSAIKDLLTNFLLVAQEYAKERFASESRDVLRTHATSRGINSYDVYFTVYQFTDYRLILQGINFPFRTPSLLDTIKPMNDGLLAGLSNYLNSYGENLMKLPPVQIMNIENSRGLTPTGNYLNVVKNLENYVVSNLNSNSTFLDLVRYLSQLQ